MSLELIPNEILKKYIFACLDNDDLLEMRRVSKRFKLVAQSTIGVYRPIGLTDLSTRPPDYLKGVQKLQYRGQLVNIKFLYHFENLKCLDAPLGLNLALITFKYFESFKLAIDKHEFLFYRLGRTMKLVCRYGSLKFAKYLIERLESIDLEEYRHAIREYVKLACQSNKFDIVKYLGEKYPFVKHHYNILLYMAFHGRNVSWILSKYDVSYDAHLMIQAVRGGNMKNIRVIGNRFDFTDNKFRSDLLKSAVLSQNVNVIKYLNRKFKVSSHFSDDLLKLIISNCRLSIFKYFAKYYCLSWDMEYIIRLICWKNRIGFLKWLYHFYKSDYIELNRITNLTIIELRNNTFNSNRISFVNLIIRKHCYQGIRHGVLCALVDKYGKSSLYLTYIKIIGSQLEPRQFLELIAKFGGFHMGRYVFNEYIKNDSTYNLLSYL